ncbi:hypothetical protein FGO68_gene9079 [Halteria grandinella]|uniref:Uncharacterized protein n=1 Tax=Halteria grandinella TaxID=5974 RepID=A0A8J8T4Y0_HALGN|nr:hypothetical protein FGO68_gene9079 [Halteria grandinella]
MHDFIDKIASLDDSFAIIGLRISASEVQNYQDALSVAIELSRRGQSSLKIVLLVNPMPPSLLKNINTFELVSQLQLPMFKTLEKLQIEAHFNCKSIANSLARCANVILKERGQNLKHLWFSVLKSGKPEASNQIIDDSAGINEELQLPLNELKNNISGYCKKLEQLYLFNQGDPNLQQDLFELSLGNTLPHLKRLYVPQIIEQLPIIEQFKLNQTSKLNPNLQQIIINHVPYFKGENQWEIFKSLAYAMKPYTHTGKKIYLFSDEVYQSYSGVDLDEFAQIAEDLEPNININFPFLDYGLFQDRYDYQEVKIWNRIMDVMEAIKKKH